MASNDPSRRASAASSSEMSLVDPAVVAKLLPKDEKLSGKLKMKKSIAKAAKPKDAESIPVNAKITATSRSASPISPLFNEGDVALSAGKAIEDNSELIQCKHCKKPMEKVVWQSHNKLCLQKKQEKARKKKEAKEAKASAAKEEARAKDAKEIAGEKDRDGDTQMEEAPSSAPQGGADVADEGVAPPEGITKSAKKGVAKAIGEMPKKGKKRKADADGGEKEPKKKKAKKDEPPKPKVPKPKGPVDVEKQCGVALGNAVRCARSLTCKSHSMGAKRSVPGRSLPYDTLLQQYQKKNQAKQQKAAMDANAPLIDDLDAAGPVDSDEEKDAVMAAIARSRPRPLEQHVFVPVRRKYQLVCMKEMLGNALGGRGLFGAGPSYAIVSAAASASSSASGGGGGGAAEGSGDGGGDTGGRRASFVSGHNANMAIGRLQRAGTAVPVPGSRKASLA